MQRGNAASKQSVGAKSYQTQESQDVDKPITNN